MAASIREDVKGPMLDLEKEIPDLTGKVALVTGANSVAGVGFHTAHQLAIKGAKVYIGARSISSAKDAIAEMRAQTPSLGPDQFKSFVVDLSDLKAVKAAAEKLIANETRLDILVNNAALLARPLDKDSHGISISFITNHLASFVLTTTLLPLLEKTAALNPGGVRIVMVSSTTHALPPIGIRFASLDDFNAELGGTDDQVSNLSRYGLSKLANILFAKSIEKRFLTKGIPAVALSLHPGGVATKGARKYVESTDLTESSKTKIYKLGLPPLQGAMTSLFASTSPKVWQEREAYGGGYLMPFGVLWAENENASNDSLANELWETSKKVVDGVLNEQQ